MKNQLNEKQKIINKKYAEEGLTDEVLELQLEVNQLRHEHNITDPEQRVYGRFVQ